jgi:uncharacterized protein involved in exopolysaccharide biosynthesis
MSNDRIIDWSNEPRVLRARLEDEQRERSRLEEMYAADAAYFAETSAEKCKLEDEMAALKDRAETDAAAKNEQFTISEQKQQHLETSLVVLTSRVSRWKVVAFVIFVWAGVASFLAAEAWHAFQN